MYTSIGSTNTDPEVDMYLDSTLRNLIQEVIAATKDLTDITVIPVPFGEQTLFASQDPSTLMAPTGIEIDRVLYFVGVLKEKVPQSPDQI